MLATARPTIGRAGSARQCLADALGGGIPEQRGVVLGPAWRGALIGVGRHVRHRRAAGRVVDPCLDCGGAGIESEGGRAWSGLAVSSQPSAATDLLTTEKVQYSAAEIIRWFCHPERGRSLERRISPKRTQRAELRRGLQYDKLWGHVDPRVLGAADRVAGLPTSSSPHACSGGRVHTSCLDDQPLGAGLVGGARDGEVEDAVANLGERG